MILPVQDLGAVPATLCETYFNNIWRSVFGQCVFWIPRYPLSTTEEAPASGPEQIRWEEKMIEFKQILTRFGRFGTNNKSLTYLGRAWNC